MFTLYQELQSLNVKQIKKQNIKFMSNFLLKDEEKDKKRNLLTSMRVSSGSSGASNVMKPSKLGGEVP